jgi:hypothetical protein
MDLAKLPPNGNRNQTRNTNARSQNKKRFVIRDFNSVQKAVDKTGHSQNIPLNECTQYKN